jgi:uncharacterized protein YwbE
VNVDGLKSRVVQSLTTRSNSHPGVVKTAVNGEGKFAQFLVEPAE